MIWRLGGCFSASTKDKQFHTILAIVGSMSGPWLLGVVALSRVPADNGAAYAYQDVTGQFTVYVRGAQRMATP